MPDPAPVDAYQRTEGGTLVLRGPGRGEWLESDLVVDVEAAQ